MDIGSYAGPLSVPAELDPTSASAFDSYALSLRLGAVLRGHLLIPQQFVLFNPHLRRLWKKDPEELATFLSEAPITVSEPDMARYRGAEPQARAAIVEDHPFLIGVDRQQFVAYSASVDHSLRDTTKIAFKTVPAAESFPSKFIGRCSGYAISEEVVKVLEEVSIIASQRDGRRQTKQPSESWNRNDLFLCLQSDRFDDRLSTANRERLRAARSDAHQSVRVLDCAREAYLGVLAEQLYGQSLSVAFNSTLVRDVDRCVQLGSIPQSRLVKAISQDPSRLGLRLDGLAQCPWSEVTSFLADPGFVSKYNAARWNLLNANEEHRWICMEALADALREYLLSVDRELCRRRSATVYGCQIRWIAIHRDTTERAAGLALSLGLGYATKELQFILGAVLSETIERLKGWAARSLHVDRRQDFVGLIEQAWRPSTESTAFDDPPHG